MANQQQQQQKPTEAGHEQLTLCFTCGFILNSTVHSIGYKLRFELHWGLEYQIPNTGNFQLPYLVLYILMPDKYSGHDC